jgi:hypothetical protein
LASKSDAAEKPETRGARTSRIPTKLCAFTEYTRLAPAPVTIARTVSTVRARVDGE